MTALQYSFRPSAFTRQRTYRIGPNALHWTAGGQENRIAYSDVEEVRLYRRLMRGDATIKNRTTFRFQLRCRSGRRVTLSPLHYKRFRRWEDRSASYTAFTNILMAQLRNRNPDLKVAAELHWTLRWRNAGMRNATSALGKSGQKLIAFLGKRDAARTIRAGGRIMRAIGPWLRGQHVARANLKAAFPEKSDREIDHVLRGVWDNFGRVMAEYAFLDQLAEYDPLAGERNWIDIDQPNTRRLHELRDNAGPVLFFGAHLANWELPPLMAASFGIELTAIFRPFDAAAMNDLIVKMRGRVKLIPARFGAAAEINNILAGGSSFGILVDQHYIGGTDVMFFGRPCKVNPALGRLARQYDCPIHGVRVIRLPSGRFRGEVTDRLLPPRDRDGRVDIAATMQMITGIVEGWVREHPEQWLWLHRRWR